VRRGAAYTLSSVFSSIPGASKDQAWQDLIRLTQDDDSWVRRGTAYTLSSAFISIPDASKDQAWQDLHKLSQDDDSEVRGGAAYALGSSFISIPDASKAQAWQDLHGLMQDDDSRVQRRTASALGSSFISIPDASKAQAWQDLHRFMQDDDSEVRGGAAYALGSAFGSIPEASKDQAWQDLHRLMQDDDSEVRRRTASALGFAFSSIPDTSKAQAWQDLHRFTQDGDRKARVSANYSAGRISIQKAIEAESENDFKDELENALNFLKKSTDEALHINPAQFCYPFYKSVYSITFEEQNVESERKKYIEMAEKYVKRSEIKKTLLEIVKNLENLLKDVYKSKEKGLNAWKSNLKAYKRYSDRACDLLEITEKDAPGATMIIKKGLPIIDQRIKEIIAEIQEKAKTACQKSKGTLVEEIACSTNQIVQKWEISDQDQMTENVEDLISTLKAKIPYIPQNEPIYNRIEKIRNESDLMKQYKKVEVLIALIPTATIGELYMGDKYTAGQVGAQGHKAHAHDLTFNQIWNQVGDRINLSELAEELAELRLKLKKDAIEPEHDISIGAIASAESSAKNGNGPETLEFLSKAGKWALDVAIKIGVPVATEALKTASGL
jgi:HEAT repeat protein